MLKIDQSVLNVLGFDFEEAVNSLRQAREDHRFTVDVPAPTAHWLVEAAVNSGGYEVVQPPETQPAEVAASEVNVAVPSQNADEGAADEGPPPMLAEQLRRRELLQRRLYQARSQARSADLRAVLKLVMDLLIEMYSFEPVTDESVDDMLDGLGPEPG